MMSLLSVVFSLSFSPAPSLISLSMAVSRADSRLPSAIKLLISRSDINFLPAGEDAGLSQAVDYHPMKKTVSCTKLLLKVPMK